MSTPVNVLVDGGTQPERDYVSRVIEEALVESNISVVNQIAEDSPTETMLDYVRQHAAHMFSQEYVIEITQPTIISDDEVDSVVGENTDEML